jgi:hypothetical protein
MIMKKRQDILRFLNGLQKGRISVNELFDDWAEKWFHLFAGVPGYVEDSRCNPVDPEKFIETLKTWPKVKLMLIENSAEEVIPIILVHFKTGKYPHLADLLSEKERGMCEDEIMQEEIKVEEINKRVEEERVMLAEGRIPPQPAVVQDEGSTIIDDWVIKYRPAQYEKNGYLYRRYPPNPLYPGELGYERSEENHIFHDALMEMGEKEREKVKEQHKVKESLTQDMQMPVPVLPPADPPPRRYCIL